MSDYQGNIIIKNPATPTGPFENGSAPGVWKLSEVLPFVRQGIWPTQGIAAKDPFFPNVSMLLSTTSLGNANNNLFVDSSGAFNPISRNGNATQGSFTPYGASWSNYFDGSGDYLTTPSSSALGFGTGDFTVETWFYTPAFSAVQALIDLRSSAIAEPLALSISATGLARSYDGTVRTGGQFTANQWNHIAWARVSGVNTVYVNGVSGHSWTNSGDYGSSRPSWIGVSAGGGAEPFTGYMSNIRVVKGTAVYTSNFTVPTSPLTAISGTSLLTCQSNRFRDASTNNFTVTVNGNTLVTEYSPFSPAYPGIVYNQSDIQYWSGYFDGSGDYVDFPSSSALGLSTGSFTVEGWFYAASTGSNAMFYASTTSGSLFIRLGQFSGSAYSGIQIGRVGIANDTFSSFSFSAGQWYHIAVVRNSTTMTIYVNGTSINSFSNSTDYGSSATVRLGATESGGENFNGYMSNVRTVKGTAVYTGAFTPPTAPLTAIANTSLLTCQNAAFTDNSTNNFVVTISGNTTVTGNNPFQAGYYSNYFDGSGDYLNVATNAALSLGTGDLTCEAWVWVTGGSGNRHIFSGGTNNAFGFYINSSGKIAVAKSGVVEIIASTTTIPLNTWTNVAVSRSGNTFRIFVNGTLEATVTSSQDFTTSNDNRVGFEGGSSAYVGYISNLRVIKGTALYAASFTPSTTPLTAVSGTSLLTCQSNRLIDTSANALAITKNGDVTVQSFDPFYTSTIASNGGSMYFDGSGDYLTTINTNFSGDATVECWLYVNSLANPFQIFGTNNGTADGKWLGAFVTTNGALVGGAAAGVSSGYSSANGTIKTGQWTHIAWVKTSSGVFAYVNGTQVATCSLAQGYAYNATPLYIGRLDGNNSYCLNGYISNLRMINGTALYTSTFTPPTAPLTPTPATTLLVNGMNAGAYDATAINDMETVGNAQVSTAVSKFGGSSMAFDGTGDAITLPTNPALALGANNFTVECWFYATATMNYGTMWTTDDGSNSASGIRLVTGPNNNSLTVGIGGSAVLTASSTYTNNIWNHAALVRNSGTITLYLNGTNVGTLSNTTNFSLQTFIIGRYGAAYYWTGYIDEMRVTPGVARYTANFTPPTQAFPTY